VQLKRAHPGPGVGGEAVAEGADDGVESGGGAEDEAGVGALQHEVATRDEHLPGRRRHPAPRSEQPGGWETPNLAE
jgi:hypothetical protein